MKNEYEVRGDVTAIYVNFKGEKIETLIDTSDLLRAQEFPLQWGVSTGLGYYPYVYGRIRSNKKTKSYQLNRWLFGSDLNESLNVDHRNHDTLDNRRKQNLRQLTHSENLQNMNNKRNNSSGIRGISWNTDTEKWIAQVHSGGKNVYRQEFIDIEEAKKAVITIRKRVMEYSDENIELKDNGEYILNCDREKRQTASGIKNIHYRKYSKKWVVSMTINKKRLVFGNYKKLEDAKNKLEIVRRVYEAS